MKKTFPVLLFTLLLSQFSWSQYRISLDSSNAYQSGISYLIDIPYNLNIKKLCIDNRAEMIPAEVLFSTKNRLWTNVDTLAVLERISPEKGAGKPTDTGREPFVEYIIPRYGPTTKSNGISRSLTKYTKLAPFSNRHPDSLLVYYSEEYGSSCCPRDSKFDIRPTLYEFIKQFEYRFKVKIGNSYSESRGEEGESIIYLTLDGLTPRQKIDFMDTRIYQLILHQDLKKIVHVPTVFMPFLVSKRNLKTYN